MDIATWLRELGLERYEAAFRDNDVDVEILPKLTAEDLLAIGVTSVGHRRRLLDAIAALTAAAVEPSAVSSAEAEIDKPRKSEAGRPRDESAPRRSSAVRVGEAARGLLEPDR